MLIAEIGSNHFGSYDRAKELIKEAKNCGADIVKGQAFRAEDLSGGSMPPHFYKQCQFTLTQYLDLIEYARKNVGIELFYSIFCRDGSLDIIRRHQKLYKISAGSFRDKEYALSDLTPNTIVSVGYTDWKPAGKASVLYASEYMVEDPNLYIINALKSVYGRDIGYSDHTIGIDNCVLARQHYGCNIIEKHFTLKKNMQFRDIVFRDTVHGADPQEFRQLAEELRRPYVKYEMPHLRRR